MSIKKDFHFDEPLYKKFDDIIKEYYTQYVKLNIFSFFHLNYLIKGPKKLQSQTRWGIIAGNQEKVEKPPRTPSLADKFVQLYRKKPKNSYFLIKKFNRTGLMWFIIAWKTLKARGSKLSGSLSSMSREWERFSFSWKNLKKF